MLNAQLVTAFVITWCIKPCQPWRVLFTSKGGGRRGGWN